MALPPYVNYFYTSLLRIFSRQFKAKQLTNILITADPSLLLMTVNDRGNGRLQQAFADVELSFPGWNPETLYNQTGSQFWAVAADKRQERAFFIDIRYNMYLSESKIVTLKKIISLKNSIIRIIFVLLTLKLSSRLYIR